MAAKKTAAVRASFQEAVDRYKKIWEFDYVTPLQTYLDEPISESDRNRVQDSFAKERFGSESDYSLKLAFEAADLDPRDRSAPDILLRLLAMAIFPGRERTRGRKREWTPQRWTQLLSDYDQIKRDNLNSSDQRICNKLIKKFALRYSGIGSETVRRNLAHARDPSKNTLVAELAERISAIMKSEISKLDPNTDLPASKLKELSERSAVNWLSKAWELGRNLAN